MKRVLLWALALGAIVGGPAYSQAAVPASDIVADDRDQYTLFYRHPVNRQIFEQMGSPAFTYRLSPKQNVFTALSDVTMGTQQTIDAESQSRYHGWFIADTYIGVRPVSGLDINMNVLALNPSASDGFRGSASVHPGLSLHLYHDLFKVDGSPVRFDIFGPDLGWITTGNGLLVESTPAEGVVGVARYKDWELRHSFIGRVYWHDDDYEDVTLSALRGKLQLNFVNWQKHDPPVGTLPIAPSYALSETETDFALKHAYYGTLVTRFPIGDTFRLATEFGYRIKEHPKMAALLRADAIIREGGWYGIHVGYQFRYYQAGFGPRDRLITPTWQFKYASATRRIRHEPLRIFGNFPSLRSVVAYGDGRSACASLGPRGLRRCGTLASIRALEHSAKVRDVHR